MMDDNGRVSSHIFRATRVDENVVRYINSLLVQLSPDAQKLTADCLRKIFDETVVLLATSGEGEEIVGMLSLCHAQTPTGSKWWIEDVVVDSACRGRGLGRQLVNSAVGYVRAHGGGQLELTSRPSRVAANGLYQSMGFMRKETNLYIMPVLP